MRVRVRSRASARTYLVVSLALAGACAPVGDLPGTIRPRAAVSSNGHEGHVRSITVGGTDATNSPLADYSWIVDGEWVLYCAAGAPCRPAAVYGTVVSPSVLPSRWGGTSSDEVTPASPRRGAWLAGGVGYTEGSATLTAGYVETGVYYCLPEANGPACRPAGSPTAFPIATTVVRRGGARYDVAWIGVRTVSETNVVSIAISRCEIGPEDPAATCLPATME